MNEQLKQIAIKAQVEHCISHVRLQEFAELIIKECAGVTLDYKNDAYYTGWCDHAEEILRHFGVE